MFLSSPQSLLHRPSVHEQSACGRFGVSQVRNGTRQGTRQVPETQALAWTEPKDFTKKLGPWEVQQSRPAWAGSVWTGPLGQERDGGWRVSTMDSS